MMPNRSTNFLPHGRTIRHRFGAILHARLLACVLVLLSCQRLDTAREIQRILFVGNSVIYTNNLPAVFESIAVAQKNAPTYSADMFALGGATLTELSRDNRLLQLLRSGSYDIVVFQERGGDDLCVLTSGGLQSPDCIALIDSHLGLASLARRHGATVLYLGTYQLAPGPSRAIVRAERKLAAKMAARYVQVSERMRMLRESESELPWLHFDGGHPGVATTALMGVLIYETLNGNEPAPVELCIDAEMYGPEWKHDGVLRRADMVSKPQPRRCVLDQFQMRIISQGAAAPQLAVYEQAWH